MTGGGILLSFLPPVEWAFNNSDPTGNSASICANIATCQEMEGQGSNNAAGSVSEAANSAPNPDALEEEAERGDPSTGGGTGCGGQPCVLAPARLSDAFAKQMTNELTDIYNFGNKIFCNPNCVSPRQDPLEKPSSSQEAKMMTAFSVGFLFAYSGEGER